AVQTAAALLRYGASALIRQADLSQKLLKARLPVERSILTVDGQVEHVRVRLDATFQPVQCFRPISKSHVDGSDIELERPAFSGPSRGVVTRLERIQYLQRLRSMPSTSVDGPAQS